MNGRFSLELEELQRWIGRTQIAHDIVTPRLADELGATLDSGLVKSDPGSSAQLGMHWCLAPPAPAASALGNDGHPARGGFLPPVPLPRRMWVGGHLRLQDRLLVGDEVERSSRIVDVTIKQGQSGILCFVAVDHVITTERGPAILERQDVVYLGPPSADSPVATPVSLSTPQWKKEFKIDTVMLFRYSALTFNSHRIHYDQRYVTEIERYPGLVCHAPLQATLLLNFAFTIKGRAPAFFKFRSLKPLFEGVPLNLCARESSGALQLWIQTADGIQTMDAEAHDGR